MRNNIKMEPGTRRTLSVAKVNELKVLQRLSGAPLQLEIISFDRTTLGYDRGSCHEYFGFFIKQPLGPKYSNPNSALVSSGTANLWKRQWATTSPFPTGWEPESLIALLSYGVVSCSTTTLSLKKVKFNGDVYFSRYKNIVVDGGDYAAY